MYPILTPWVCAGVGRDCQQEGEHAGGPQRQGGGPRMERGPAQLRQQGQAHTAGRWKPQYIRI